MGKKPYKYDPAVAETVRRMAMVGNITQAQMAELLHMSLATLHKHYKRELDLGAADATAKVGGRLYDMAMADGPGAVSAAIFWMKARAGWSEKVQVEQLGPDGKPLDTRPQVNIYLPDNKRDHDP